MNVVEEWKPIPGFSDYDISSLGRVRSRRRGGLHMKRFSTSRGYKIVQLANDQGPRTCRVNRLVAEAFLPPPNEGADVVRHLDGSPVNNAVNNLAWGTVSQNQLDSVAHGTHNHARVTHCPRRHPYDETNTLVDGTGRRRCRTCRRDKRLRPIAGTAASPTGGTR